MLAKSLLLSASFLMVPSLDCHCHVVWGLKDSPFPPALSPNELLRWQVSVPLLTSGSYRSQNYSQMLSLYNCIFSNSVGLQVLAPFQHVSLLTAYYFSGFQTADDLANSSLGAGTQFIVSHACTIHL